MSSRTWVKIYCDNWFEGSIRQESSLVRSVFTDLVALAGKTGVDGKIGVPGLICGFSDEQYSQMLNIPIEDWLVAKERLLNHPDGSENRIKINGKNIIEIINWNKYQSEYDKRRDRNRNIHADKTSDTRTDNTSALEGEGEREVEVDQNRSKDQKKDQDRVTRAKKTARFTPPTIDDVTKYCQARENNVDPIRWHAHYTANGWRVGKNPMKNWKAAVVTWERSN